jgi:hypothetical protein
METYAFLTWTHVLQFRPRKIDNDAQGTSIVTASLKAFAGMAEVEHLPCHHEYSSLELDTSFLH